TGNGKTVDTTITIQAKIGQSGLELTDSSSFGGYSSCFNIIEFSNEQGYYIRAFIFALQRANRFRSAAFGYLTPMGRS
ncbi:hypothetical protein JQK62_18345, partial [Leptospira santarosai]|nr:hypothetical protein [Leptospira santarosai]